MQIERLLISYKRYSLLNSVSQIRTYTRKRKNSLNVLNSLSINNKVLESLNFDKKIMQPYDISWEVLGGGKLGVPRSLLLATRTSSYLFNCGEGTQRLITSLDCATSIFKMANVFITNRSWMNLGGFPGFCLTLRNAKAKGVTLHGPPGCLDIYETTKNFIAFHDFDLKTFKERVYTDNCLDIHQISLTKNTRIFPKEVHSSWLIDDTYEDSADDPYSYTVKAYICRFHPRDGRLKFDKCSELGVPVGPMLGELKSGKDVTLPDGRIVKSADVVEKPSKASSNIVLEVPDIDYLEALLNAPDLQAQNNEILQSIFHFTPQEVIEDPRYIEWMQQFPSSVQHVFLNEDSPGMSITQAKVFQTKLRMMNNELFPPLLGTSDDPSPNFDVETKLCYDFHGMKAIQGIPGLVVDVRSKDRKQLSIDSAVPYDEEKAKDEVMTGEEINKIDLSEYVDKLKEVLDHSNSCLKESVGKKQFPEITFLGTGSAIPGRYRNVSSILAEVKPDHFILMDCGEGSLGQLARLKGVQGATRVLKNLKAVYISHQHSDHHMGIITWLLERAKVFKKEKVPLPLLYIIVTRQYREFLTVYHNKIESILDNVELVRNEEINVYTKRRDSREDMPEMEVQLINPEEKAKVLEHTGLSNIKTTKVIHAPHAYAVSMTTDKGYRFLYSGDTRPCRHVVKLGKDADLLIHEGTISKRYYKDAIIKKHSTFSEAIEVGKEMNAKFIMLTHFSQRYPKFPYLDDIEEHENVGVAFDNMTVNPSNLHHIRSLYPALRHIFQKDEDLLKEREKKQQYWPKMEQSKDFIIDRLNRRDLEATTKRSLETFEEGALLSKKKIKAKKRGVKLDVKISGVDVSEDLLKLNQGKENDHDMAVTDEESGSEVGDEDWLKQDHSPEVEKEGKEAKKMRTK